MNKQKWQAAQFHFNLCQDSVENLHTDQRDLKYLRFGNKPGKLLAHLTREAYIPISIPKIRKADRTYTTNPAEINMIFRTFYATLYAKQVEDNPLILAAKSDRFLRSPDMPILDKNELEMLNGKIQIQEIQALIKGLSRGKAPSQMGKPLTSIRPCCHR